MLKYDDEMLQEISSGVDLLEYVSRFINLKPKGKDYFGECFKHLDITPSFSINPEKNLYYCHSCGIGGGIIGFLMDYENLTFEEAVNKSSNLANIDLNTMCQSQTVKYLRKINKEIKNDDVFEHVILDKSILQNYKKCEIQEWVEEGIPQTILDLYDVRLDEKANRIIYPVYDINGELLNIKGRTRFKEYKQMNINKYMNYYKIGVLDYFQGLNLSISIVNEKEELIIFESIKSVMKLKHYGIDNSASAEKHTLTHEQIILIIKLKIKNVVLAYDSDVSYTDKEIKKDIDKLKRFTNLYVIEDPNLLLGGKLAKNSPVDCGKLVWDQLYKNRRKII